MMGGMRDGAEGWGGTREGTLRLGKSRMTSLADDFRFVRFSLVDASSTMWLTTRRASREEGEEEKRKEGENEEDAFSFSPFRVMLVVEE